MDKSLISVIVVNYKDYDYLRKCLDSLIKTTYPKIEIIVVDNESELHEINKLKEEFKQVQFFSLNENLNYAGGNNYGIGKSKGEFIVLLNNDTIVTKNWLEPLVREGFLQPKAFYQPLILSLEHPDIVASLGCTLHISGIAFPLGVGKSINEVSLPKEKVEVFYCSGACIFASREILTEFGGLDSNYWTYYEDVNLGWKGRLHGYPSYLVSDSRIYHKGGATYGQQLSSRKLYLIERGRLSSILRNYSNKSILLLLPIILILELLLVIYLLPKALSMTKIHASADFLRNSRSILKERRKIQTTRTKTDKDISRYMSTFVDHPLIGKVSRRYQQVLIRISKRLMTKL